MGKLLQSVLNINQSVYFIQHHIQIIKQDLKSGIALCHFS